MQSSGVALILVKLCITGNATKFVMNNTISDFVLLRSSKIQGHSRRSQIIKQEVFMDGPSAIQMEQLKVIIQGLLDMVAFSKMREFVPWVAFFEFGNSKLCVRSLWVSH